MFKRHIVKRDAAEEFTSSETKQHKKTSVVPDFIFREEACAGSESSHITYHNKYKEQAEFNMV